MILSQTDTSMARFQRRRPSRRMAAPIVSYKHQASTAVTYGGTDANNITFIMLGGAPNSEQSGINVSAGHKVYSVDLSVSYSLTAGSGTSTFSWMLVHLRDDQNIGSLFAASGASNWSTIGVSKGRNQVIKSFTGIVGSEDAGPRLYNLHIKIPKQWHRIREGDALVIVFNADEIGSLLTAHRYKDYS